MSAKHDPPDGLGTLFWAFWGVVGVALLVAIGIGLLMLLRMDAG